MDYQNKINWDMIGSLSEWKELAFSHLFRELSKIPGFVNDASCVSLLQYFKTDRHKDGSCYLFLVHLVGVLFTQKQNLIDQLHKAIAEQRTVYLLTDGTRLEQKDENPSIEKESYSLAHERGHLPRS